VITSKTWFNGTGNVLRSGIGAGSAQTSFDTVATVYDSMGRMAKQSNPYAGDASGIGTGQCSSNPYPYLCWTTTAYDKLSRVTQVTLPDNQTVRTSYTGSTVTVTDQVGRQRQSTADGLGRMTSVVEQNPSTGGVPDPLNYQTTYSYDVLDNLTQVNQGGQLRTFVYDALSRSTSQTTPEAGTVTFTYNDASEVLKRTDARGVETHYKYDSLNRPVQVWYTGVGGDDAGTTRPALPSGVAATSDVTISYNAYASSQSGNGQVSQVTDQAGNETYVYDSLARLLLKTRVIDAQSYQTEYLYNTANQMTTLIYPSGKRVRTNHDSLGRTTGLDKVDSVGGVLSSYMTSVGYNNAGQVTNVALSNGINETYGYSADRLQLTSQTATKGSTLMSLTYSYSALGSAFGAGTTPGNTGQLASISGTINSQSRNQAFTYDNLGRLLTATGWSAWTRRFAYDRWGNRTGMWDALAGGVQLQNIAIDTTGSVANNRIANVNGFTYSYDQSGNCTSDGAQSYGYDGEGRQVTVDSGATYTSTFDSNNWRLKKVNGGLTTHYVWEGSQVIAEYNGSTGTLISEYVYAGSRMVAREQGAVLRYYHQDRLSTRLITDSNGSVVGTQDHFPFGEDTLTGTGESEKHRFTTYERDSESGTDHAINRQYSTNTGRFTRPDPIGGLFVAPQSLNRYAYTMNDPINLCDPLGLYEPCIHQAMTEYLATEAGLAPATSTRLGEFAGDAPGGADSDDFKVMLPRQAYSPEKWAIHFPTEEQLAKFKSTFWGELNRGRTADLISAGHTLHAIEDGHGAHKGYIDNDLGHGSGVIFGDPDVVIGDPIFISVSNEIYQFLRKKPDVRLTDKQIEGLMTAVLRKCRDAGKKLKVSPYYRRPGSGGGEGGAYGGGFGQYMWWNLAFGEFLNWLDSIQTNSEL
jgi:RHS repeat-associated protein